MAIVRAADDSWTQPRFGSQKSNCVGSTYALLRLLVRLVCVHRAHRDSQIFSIVFVIRPLSVCATPACACRSIGSRSIESGQSVERRSNWKSSCTRGSSVLFIRRTLKESSRKEPYKRALRIKLRLPDEFFAEDPRAKRRLYGLWSVCSPVTFTQREREREKRRVHFAKIHFAVEAGVTEGDP